MRFIFSVLIFFYITVAYADNIAIMLYIDNPEIGDELYSKYTAKLGFLRKFKGNYRYNSEYHVTLGMVENIPSYEKEKFVNHLKQNLKIPENQEFIFGVTSMLGKGVPFIVSIPENVEDFVKLNNELYKITKEYNPKLKFTKTTIPQNYIPHLTLNAKLHNQIDINQLVKVFKSLNNDLNGYKIRLSKLEING